MDVAAGQPMAHSKLRLGQPPAHFTALQQTYSRRLVPKRHCILKDYIIPGQTLGVGISGKVKLCINKMTGQRCALKILNDTPKARREIDLHFRCSMHPNVVGIIDVYENLNNRKHCLLLIMECMEGGELFNRIQKKSQFTEREAAEMVRDVASAVQYIHSMKIAHRDLKPENILFVSNDGRSTLKLTDFGFAKEVDQVLQTPCYTPYYVAPEVLYVELRKTSRYDQSCDMWSLGVILYILLCGYPPFYSEGGASISPGMKMRIREGLYDFPEDEWGAISPSVKYLIRRLLDVSPERRMTIDEMMAIPWIDQADEVPITPLHSIKALRDDPGQLDELREGMEKALCRMRVDEHKMVAPINAASSSLLNRRKERANS